MTLYITLGVGRRELNFGVRDGKFYAAKTYDPTWSRMYAVGLAVGS